MLHVLFVFQTLLEIKLEFRHHIQTLLDRLSQSRAKHDLNLVEQHQQLIYLDHLLKYSSDSLHVPS